MSTEAEYSNLQQAKKFSRKISRSATANYLLFLPQQYQRASSKRWPLILFLHGAGQRGKNVWLVAKHGPPKVAASQPGFPFLVVSPQCPEGQLWSNESLLPLLEEVTREYRVDRTRVYLTGLSMGGYGTWNLGLSHPERFAAIAPICGGGNMVLLGLADPTNSALKSLPIWAFHGARDEVVNLSESKRMVEAARAFGCDAKLTIYPDAGHDSWTVTYENRELYQWFLKHHR
jgi:predicted peptidase